jgi:threonine/homoserine efflux transporter RhtA
MVAKNYTAFSHSLCPSRTFSLAPVGDQSLIVALLSSAIPFSFDLYALPRMPARTFAVLMSVEPVFGVLSDFLILNETLAGKRSAASL